MDEESIFLEALEETDAGDRVAYLDQACAGNVRPCAVTSSGCCEPTNKRAISSR